MAIVKLEPLHDTAPANPPCRSHNEVTEHAVAHKISTERLAAIIHREEPSIYAAVLHRDWTGDSFADPAVGRQWDAARRYATAASNACIQVNRWLLHQRGGEAQQLRAKVQTEGGVAGAISYGIGADQIQDPELRSLWAAAARALAAAEPHLTALERALARAK